MADIRCSHCGKVNPDFFNNCQFCQSPLKSESMLHTGEEPKKLDTGELEQILPSWLQDARQQNRIAAEEEATKASATKPRIQKSEPLDLLAGLASQSDSDDEDVPDWLTSISPATKKTPIAQEEAPSDFFSQFEKKEKLSSESPAVEPEQKEQIPDWMQEVREPAPEQQDQLGDWFPQPSAETNPPASEPAADNGAWMRDLGAFSDAQQEPPAEKEPEDLSWLHDLETASKQTDELVYPKPGGDFDLSSRPTSSQEDLNWLDNLGRTSASSFEEPTPKQPVSSQDDLSWLDNLGGTSAGSLEEPTPKQPGTFQEDLSWLDNLGRTSASSFEEPAPKQSPSSREDLSWLENLVGAEQAPASEGPAAPVFADDLDWMKKLGGQEDTQPQEKPQLTPRTTAPLDENVVRDTTPDWLKSAMAGPSMPAPGELSMDWFSEHEKSAEAGQTTKTPGAFDETAASSLDELFGSVQDKSVSAATGFDLPFGETPGATAPQDVDSLFGVDMPDWLSREPGGAEKPSLESASTADDGSLAPVELPSWVQAMRPVDSAIEGLSASEADQITEREGPLAGFRGVIPFAPIGSSLRPKALLMKLQATDEHQAGATLIEQIINNESALQSPSPKTRVIAPQRMVRWILSVLFIVVLSLVIGSGMQSMPIFASAAVNELSTHIATLPENPHVLVVIDYEPSLAGEVEAAAGPMFEQLAVSRHSIFTFISMSPNGSGLVERLMSNTDLSRGLGYQAGVQYFNSGFLPGGSAGVLGFIENPRVLPGVGVDAFSNFEAVILMTDNSESSRVWVEQLNVAKSNDPLTDSKPLFVVSSAQAGPIIQPYVSSGQVDVMISGMPDAVQYEYVNNTRLKTARSYWDAFGVGLALAIISIVLGSLWNLFMGIRERRTEAEQE